MLPRWIDAHACSPSWFQQAFQHTCLCYTLRMTNSSRLLFRSLFHQILHFSSQDQSHLLNSQAQKECWSLSVITWKFFQCSCWFISFSSRNLVPVSASSHRNSSVLLEKRIDGLAFIPSLLWVYQKYLFPSDLWILPPSLEPAKETKSWNNFGVKSAHFSSELFPSFLAASWAKWSCSCCVALPAFSESRWCFSIPLFYMVDHYGNGETCKCHNNNLHRIWAGLSIGSWCKDWKAFFHCHMSWANAPHICFRYPFAQLMRVASGNWAW